MISIYIKRSLGIISLLFGVLLTAWFMYNQFVPTEEFKTGFRSIFQLIVPILFLYQGWKWLKYEGKGIEEISPPTLNIPELSKSISKAQESINFLISKVQEGKDGAFVKIKLKGQDESSEHIWTYVHFFKDDYFNISLVNDPFDKNLYFEGRKNVPLREIEDWQFVNENGDIRGGYSLIALFRYHEKNGVKLSPLMIKQKRQLLDYSKF